MNYKQNNLLLAGFDQRVIGITNSNIEFNKDVAIPSGGWTRNMHPTQLPYHKSPEWLITIVTQMRALLPVLENTKAVPQDLTDKAEDDVHEIATALVFDFDEAYDLACRWTIWYITIVKPFLH